MTAGKEGSRAEKGPKKGGIALIRMVVIDVDGRQGGKQSGEETKERRDGVEGGNREKE